MNPPDVQKYLNLLRGIVSLTLTDPKPLLSKQTKGDRARAHGVNVRPLVRELASVTSRPLLAVTLLALRPSLSAGWSLVRACSLVNRNRRA